MTSQNLGDFTTYLGDIFTATAKASIEAAAGQVPLAVAQQARSAMGLPQPDPTKTQQGPSKTSEWVGIFKPWVPLIVLGGIALVLVFFVGRRSR